MMRRLFVSIGILLLSVSHAEAQSKKITVTFDELPISQTFVKVSKAEVTTQIIGSLRELNITATGFVVGEQIATSADLIGEWLNAGHTLGSMTWSNQDFHDVGMAEFMRQVKQGQEALDPILSQFGQKRRYFRFPFLHYGATSGDKAKARQLLESQKMVIAHVTVKADDYLYNLRLEQLGLHADSVRLEQLMIEYISHVLGELARQEELAMLVAGKPVTHILQLRANRLNGLFCWNLLSAIKDEGYKFVTLDQALADPAYTITEKYTGNRGVGYLDMVAESRRKK
jgi:peptidoglycan/xylan/chitin deacetylase (PgdA/CDA1 family)